MTFAIALMVACGLGLANFAYQGMAGHDWILAMERTWFQTTACLMLALADYAICRSVGGAA